MKITFWGDSITRGYHGASYFSILEAKILEHTLINRGTDGDNIKTIKKRIKVTHDDSDIAFLWIGVNDVFARMKIYYALINTFIGKRPSINKDEFIKHYEEVLDILTAKYKKVFIVEPAIIGEQKNNECNTRIRRYSESLKTLTEDYQNATFISIHDKLFSEIDEENVSEYLPTNGPEMIFDYLFHSSDYSIEKVSASRNLQLTLDGVHLNKRGAEIIAKAFEDAIRT